MNNRKILAVILSVALLVSVVLPAGVFPVLAAGPVDKVAYVNQSSGNDSTGAIDNAAKPYKSISEAIKKLDALSGDINRVIKIQGNYTVKGSTSGDYRGGQVNDNYTGFAAHTNPITITGENGTANKLTFSAPLNRGLGGPIAIDNITYTVVGDTRLHTLGHSLTIGESAVAVDSSGSDVYFGALSGHSVDSSADEYTMVMNSGEFGRIIIGDANNTTTFSKPSKLVVDGGKLARILIGQGYVSANTTFSANVNVVLNDVTLSHANGVRLLSTSAFTNGATLQVIMNNGINYPFTNDPSSSNYYLIKVAANNGVTLDTTGVAGVYSVVGDLNGTVPVVKDASGNEVKNAYDSALGTITVGATGAYTVSWTTGGATGVINKVAYVNQSSGNDSTGAIDNAAKPYKSISEAIKKLDALTGDVNRVIKVQGNYTVAGSTSGDYRGGQVNDNFTGFAAHSNPITITGENGTANKLTFSAPLNRGLGGPIAIDNITLTVSGRLHTLGHSFTIGNSAVVVDSAGGEVYFGALDGHSVDSTANEHVMIMNTGEFYRIAIGDASKSSTFTKPIKMVVNGGNLPRIQIGQTYGSGTTTFSANVNVVLNDIEFSHNDGVRLLATSAFTNGAALQIIMNNGIAGKGNNKFTNSANATNYYLIRVSANNGVTLDTTATAGVYKIVGELGDSTPVVKDASGVEVQNAYDAAAGTITVGSVGEYTVSWNLNLTGDHTVYVNQANGDDAKDGLTVNTAVATLNKAVELIEASNKANGIIRIINTLTIDKNTYNNRMLAAHEKPITIRGNDDAAKLSLAADMYLTDGDGSIASGLLTIDNIILSNATTGRPQIVCMRQPLELGDGIVLEDTNTNKAPELLAGSYAQWPTDVKGPREQITVNGGLYYFLLPGNRAVTTNYTSYSKGLDYVQNAGRVYRLYLGQAGFDGRYGITSYSGDVNITINGGTVDQVLFADSGTAVNKHNGNAVQFIFNNGTDIEDMTMLPTAAEVEAKGGQLFIMKCTAMAGSTLSTTDDEGVYKVNGDKIAVATSADGTKVYKSSAGLLSVPKGTYTVTWQMDSNAGLIYVDSINGSDENDGTSEDAALKTIAKALELAGSASARIGIVNKAVYTNAAPVDSRAVVTFIGVTSGAVLTYGGTDMTLQSDVVLKNLTLSQDVDNGKIRTNGYNLEISDGVTFTHGSFAGLENPVIVTGKDGDKSESIVLVGSGCSGLTVGNSNATRVVLGGVELDTLTLNGTNASAQVKAIVNGGEIKAVNIADGAAYAALQVLAKNGGSILGTQAANNAWYITADDVDGTDVSFTDNAGTINVTTPADKHAVAVGGDGAVVAGKQSATDETPVTSYANTTYTDWGCFDNNNSYLVNTYNKIKNNGNLNVVYFGGSITNGYGVGQAGDPNGNLNRNTHSWRALSGQWLTETFPEAQINLYDCAIGESGTFLGVYRLQDDIIAKKPDLLFVEYAINDNYYGSSKATAALQFETIIREVKQALPDCDIVTVLTTDKNRMETSYNGQLFDQAAGHYEIAEAYGLPVMNIGMGLAKGIAAKENNNAWWKDDSIFSKYFMADGVHPFSTGHEQYYLCVKEFLENNLLHTEMAGMTPSRKPLPPVQSANLLDGDRDTYMGSEMQDLYVVGSSTGVTYSDGTFTGGSSDTSRDGHYEVASGGTITFRFTGTEFAMWTDLAQNGTYSCSIDSGSSFTVTQGGHSPTIIKSGLSSATHTISITPSAKMKIAGVFERDASKQTVKGATYTYSDFVTETLTLPAGSYRISYAAKVGDIPDPVSEDGAPFLGWTDANGNPLNADTVLTNGMTLKATWGASVPKNIVYLDATNGKDTNNGLSAATAFATLEAAIAAINKTSATNGAVHLIGSYTLPSAMPTSTKSITIIGYGNEPTLVMESSVTLGSNLTIEDLAISSDNKTFVTGNYELSLDGISNDYNTRVNAILGKENTNIDHQNFYFNGGYLYEVKVGSYYNSSKRTVAGADVVIDGGEVYVIRIGADNYAANHYGNNYTAPVNLTINNIKNSSAQLIKIYNSTQYPNSLNTFTALQFIFNNGTAGKAGTIPHDIAISQAGAANYWSMSCANQTGSTLEATSTAGTFKVNGDLVAVATDAKGNATKSQGGVLTVPAGIYTVTWELNPTPIEVYVNAASGNDENNGLTTGTAVKTLGAAIAIVEGSKNASGIVTIIGTVDNPGNLADHSKMITFRGQTAATDGILNVNGMRLHGPTTFENIYLTGTESGSNGSVRADGYELVIGENVTMPQYPYVNFYSGTYDSSNNSRRDTVTIKSGRYNRGYLGPFYCVGADESTLGVDYLQTGGTVTLLTLGGDAWVAETPVFYRTIYKGNVNIAINGGQVGEIVVLKPTNDANLTNRDTVFQGAVQVLINGEGYMTNALPAIDAAGGVWLMNGRNNNGYALEMTDKAGTFKVNSNAVTAIAYDAAGNVYVSKDGMLTVPAGTYTVEYQSSVSYINTGSKIKFFADANVNFATLKHNEIEGQMFVGWVNAQGNAPASNSFSAGDVLTAKYVAYDAADFSFIGSSIRFSNDNTKKDLRYIFQLNDNISENALISNVKFGAVAIPNCMLTVNSADFTNSAGDVKIGGVYRYNGKNYNVAKVAAEKIWLDTDDGVQYTLCLTGIASSKQDTRYAVRGYMTYTDMNGVAQVLYSEEASESLVSTAKRVLSDLGLEGDDAARFAATIANARAALQAKYTSTGSTKVSLDVSSAPAGSNGTNGIVKRSDGSTAMTFYKLKDSGLMVRDVVIDGVGGAFSEAVNVVQVTDPHLHAYNDADIAEGNPTVLESKIKRTHNNLNYSFDYGQKAIVNLVNAMEYASAYGDQTMLTGDIIDALTLGSLDLLERHVFIAYPETINMLGNHEPVRQWQHDVLDASSLDSRYAVLEEVWNHDIYYTSRVIKDKVMVIQLDSGQEKFWASQQPLLKADLATARKNGYTVLIYTHCMLSTLNSADTAVTTLYGAETTPYDLYNKGVGKSDSTGVMELIVNNADIIKGVFNGHMHSDYYTEIQAKNADGTAAVIPQYTLHGNFYENGNVLKVTVQ